MRGKKRANIEDADAVEDDALLSTVVSANENSTVNNDAQADTIVEISKAELRRKPPPRRSTFGGSRLSLNFFNSNAKKRTDESKSLASCDAHVNADDSASTSSEKSKKESSLDKEGKRCSLCVDTKCNHVTLGCNHKACEDCAIQYLSLAINESRVNIVCWQCDQPIHPNQIREILGAQNEKIYDKYEAFTLRRALILDPDTRWCPAPDCGYACIARNCAACPLLVCGACGTHFCYHCKSQWHPNQTCDEARITRGSHNVHDIIQQASNNNSSSAYIRPGDIRACPRCKTYIAKMDDGSCNHMTCGWCGADFCWLCLKEVSDLHYLSPSGCTFWGRAPWSRKKVILWQLGTLFGAPIGIALLAMLAIPAIVFGVPVFALQKTNARLKVTSMPKCRRRFLVTLALIGSALVSPLLAGVAIAVGVPMLLAYVYGVVPFSLCRQGLCRRGNTTSKSDSMPDVTNIQDVWRLQTLQALTRGNTIEEAESVRRLLSMPGESRKENKTVRLDYSAPNNQTSNYTHRSASGRSARKYRAASTISREPNEPPKQHRRGSVDAFSFTTVNFDNASVVRAPATMDDSKSMLSCDTAHSAHQTQLNAAPKLHVLSTKDPKDEAASVSALAGSVLDAKSFAGLSIGDESAHSIRVCAGSINGAACACNDCDRQRSEIKESVEENNAAAMRCKHRANTITEEPSHLLTRVEIHSSLKDQGSEFIMLSKDALMQMNIVDDRFNQSTSSSHSQRQQTKWRSLSTLWEQSGVQPSLHEWWQQVFNGGGGQEIDEFDVEAQPCTSANANYTLVDAPTPNVQESYDTTTHQTTQNNNTVESIKARLFVSNSQSQAAPSYISLPEHVALRNNSTPSKMTNRNSNAEKVPRRSIVSMFNLKMQDSSEHECT